MIIVKKTWQFITPFKDDIRKLADLKQQISKKMILAYLCSTSPKCHCDAKYYNLLWYLLFQIWSMVMVNIHAKFEVSGLNRSRDMEGFKNSKSKSRAPSLPPLTYFWISIVSVPRDQYLCQIWSF